MELVTTLIPMLVFSDPLDALADELALHDEFVLMDEVGYERNNKKDDDDKKIAAMDLDESGSGLDLDNVNVEMSQDDDEAEVSNEKKQKESASDIVEDIVASILDKIDEHEARSESEVEVSRFWNLVFESSRLLVK